MESGIVLIDKPKGISSAKAIAILKKRLGLKKIGHAGTLDPMATGLLVALIGRATRLADQAQSGHKIYSGEILLGCSSTTDDVTGVLNYSSVPIPQFSEIEKAAQEFIGTIEQVPPKVSAIKLDGKRAYKRVLAGENIEISARKVSIFGLDLSRLAADTVSFKIVCSKGTYIRSIARDLGEKLGCGACLLNLRREASYPFSVDQANELDNIGLEQVKQWWELFPDTLRFVFDSERVDRLLHGDKRDLSSIDVSASVKSGLYCDIRTREPVGILKKEESGWKVVNITERIRAKENLERSISLCQH